MRNVLTIILVLLSSMFAYSQTLNSVSGAATGVVVEDSSDPEYRIRCNFLSAEGWTAADVDSGFVFTAELSTVTPEQMIQFRIDSVEIISGNQVRLWLMLLDTDVTVLAFPSGNGAIDEGTGNIGFRYTASNAPNSIKAYINNHNMYLLDSLISANMDSITQLRSDIENIDGYATDAELSTAVANLEDSINAKVDTAALISAIDTLIGDQQLADSISNIKDLIAAVNQCSPTIYQASHGLVEGDLITFNGTGYEISSSASEDGIPVAYVCSVVSVDSFTIATEGIVIKDHGLVDNRDYYHTDTQGVYDTIPDEEYPIYAFRTYPGFITIDIEESVVLYNVGAAGDSLWNGVATHNAQMGNYTIAKNNSALHRIYFGDNGIGIRDATPSESLSIGAGDLGVGAGGIYSTTAVGTNASFGMLADKTTGLFFPSAIQTALKIGNTNGLHLYRLNSNAYSAVAINHGNSPSAILDIRSGGNANSFYVTNGSTAAPALSFTGAFFEDDQSSILLNYGSGSGNHSVYRARQGTIVYDIVNDGTTLSILNGADTVLVMYQDESVKVKAGLRDSDGDLGTPGQHLSSTGNGTDWIDGAGGFGFDALTSGNFTADITRLGGTTTTISNPSSGVYDLDIKSGAYLDQIEIFGNSTTVNSGDGSLTITIDNSSNSRDKRYSVQVYYANSNQLADPTNAGIVHSQSISGNVTTIIIPGMNNFGASGFRILLN